MADFEIAFDTTSPAAPGHYGPSQTALLLLDFHRMFVEKMGGPDALQAFRVAVQMRQWAKSKGIAVVHGVLDPDMPTFPTCKGAERFQSVVASMKAGGVEEPPELVEGGGDVTFTRKPGIVSALNSPGIQDFLQSRGIKSLILCGLSTSGCVLRTAVPATDAEYVVTTISDACADPKEGVHQMMMETILTSRAYVTTAAQFQEGYAKATGGN